MNDPATISRPDLAPSDTGDRYCHSLDEDGRALCFADISGRAVHTRFMVDTAVGSFNLAFCPGCRRPTCPRCNEISLALGRSA